MRILTIIQARLSSTRAPGKVMRRVSGKPVLGFMVESLGQCKEPFELVIATSTEWSRYSNQAPGSTSKDFTTESRRHGEEIDEFSFCC